MWAALHKRSEELAIAADDANRRGDTMAAERLYAEAAALEEEALLVIDVSKERTRGITAVSAVSLWYKAAEYDSAERLAFSALAGDLPAFARVDLRNLVQAIWTEATKEAAGVRFLPGQVFVAVRGGVVVAGGAPLELVVGKVQTIQSVFYRTIEYLRKLPLRSRGLPGREIQGSCRPWLFQAAPGSYQFSVAMEEIRQLDLFQVHVAPDVVAHKFLEILRATASEDQRDLEKAVSDADYRDAFLKLSRNLAPTGKTFESIEFRAATREAAVALTPEKRGIIDQAIRKQRPVEAAAATKEEVLGTLRAVDLNKDFLEVDRPDGSAIHIVGLKDTMDDVIGPMVNKQVKVTVVRSGKTTRLSDIELEE
jgi:hypothetical protein